MSQATKPQYESKANWVSTQVLDNNLTMSVSDKGSVMLRQTDNNKFIACFQAGVVEQIVNASGDIGNLLVSEEYKAILENKAKTKAARYQERQVATHILKAQQMAQAALDALKASGMSEQDAKALLAAKVA